MERFIHRENIANFVERLRCEDDLDTRRTLKALFAEEMQKFAGRRENLDLSDHQLRDCKQRIAQQRQAIDAQRAAGGNAGDAERLLSHLVEIEGLLLEFRSIVVGELSRKS